MCSIYKALVFHQITHSEIFAFFLLGHETVDQHAKDHGVIQQICQACKDVGFFYLTGHGVEQSSLNQIFNAMKNFFALPLEKKNAISVHNSPSFSGYIETSERACTSQNIQAES